jgi:hypothetical protein
LLLSTNPNTRKRSGFSEFKALATDMAFASTPYIKAGIDLFFFHKQRVFKCHFNHDTIQYQVTKVNKTLTNNRVFKIVSALENSQNQY